MQATIVSRLARLASMTALGFSLTTPSAAHGQSTEPPDPPPGRLVDIGGWRLHLNCTGEVVAGQPTVILEAGVGAFSVDWALVQPLVASFAHVCSYDRAGSGWSDLGPDPRTMRQIAWELHALMGKANMQPPFVLVGHSYGGALVRVYASTYPKEVAGLVLVDAQHDDYLRLVNDKEVMASTLASGRPIPPAKTAGPLRDSDIPPAVRAQIESMAAWNMQHANEPPRDKLPLEAQRMRSWATSQVKQAVATNNPYEGDELLALQAERKTQPYSYVDLPLIVLTRGRPEFDGPNARAMDAERRKNQAELASRSRNGKQLVVDGSGHHIDVEHPEVVAKAIRDVLAMVARR
jgi:pimeloyl-ACP methyl ester carboxylesterase